MRRLNPRFKNLRTPVRSLSGGQRQSVAIARAVHFDAKILIMDEPTAALGPAETAQVRELVMQLKSEGIGIFLISHDIHDVFDLSDRISVMLQSRLVGTVGRRTSHQGRGAGHDHRRQAAGAMPTGGDRTMGDRGDKMVTHRVLRIGSRSVCGPSAGRRAIRSATPRGRRSIRSAPCIVSPSSVPGA